MLALFGTGLLSSCHTLPQGTYRPVFTEAAQPVTTPAPLPIQTPGTVPIEAPGLASDSKDRLRGNMVVNTARRYLGCHYRAAAAGPKQFDCSGFTSFIYKQFGIKLNRTSRDQWQNGVEIPDPRLLIPGDLVFFAGSNAHGPIGHVGIVVECNAVTGHFSFIHAALTGVQIDQSTLQYYAKRYKGARRVLAN